MKKIFGMTLGLALFAGAGQAQTIQVNKDNRTVAVTTTDSASAEADAAVVHVGFKLYAQTSDDAYTKGSKASNAIAAAMNALGIPKENIESESQGIAEVQSFEMQNFTPEEKQQRVYVVQQSWSVKVKAADAAKTLDAAVQAGANNSGQIDWTMNDDNPLQAQAAGKALARARSIAEQMAKGLNAALGALIYASNEAPPSPVFAMNGRLATGFAHAAGGVVTMQQKAEPLSINPRKVERSATVYAVFSIQ